MEEYELITCIVQRGRADYVVNEMLKSGATGVTMFYARGTGVRQRLGLMGNLIQPEKEIILIVSRKSDTEGLFQSLTKIAQLDKVGQGIAFVQPLTHVAGFVDLKKGK